MTNLVKLLVDVNNFFLTDSYKKVNWGLWCDLNAIATYSPDKDISREIGLLKTVFFLSFYRTDSSIVTQDICREIGLLAADVYYYLVYELDTDMDDETGNPIKTVDCDNSEITHENDGYCSWDYECDNHVPTGALGDPSW